MRIGETHSAVVGKLRMDKQGRERERENLYETGGNLNEKNKKKKMMGLQNKLKKICSVTYKKILCVKK